MHNFNVYNFYTNRKEYYVSLCFQIQRSYYRRTELQWCNGVFDFNNRTSTCKAAKYHVVLFDCSLCVVILKHIVDVYRQDILNYSTGLLLFLFSRTTKTLVTCMILRSYLRRHSTNRSMIQAFNAHSNHAADTFVSWPYRYRWLMIHISYLVIIIR